MKCTPTVTSNVNYGLWVIMTCHLGSLPVTNGPIWWEMLIMQEAVYVWRQGVCGKCLYLLLSFPVNLTKIALKNSPKIKL